MGEKRYTAESLFPPNITHVCYISLPAEIPRLADIYKFHYEELLRFFIHIQ
jgi:hypothetical protein